MADDTRASEALDRALHDDRALCMSIEHDPKAPRRLCEAVAERVLAHPFSDSERASLVAVLLQGHEDVLAEAFLLGFNYYGDNELINARGKDVERLMGGLRALAERGAES